MVICCICGREIEANQGNNPQPVVKKPNSRCCNECNWKYVIPARLADLKTLEVSE